MIRRNADSSIVDILDKTSEILHEVDAHADKINALPLPVDYTKADSQRNHKRLKTIVHYALGLIKIPKAHRNQFLGLYSNLKNGNRKYFD